MRNPYVIIPIIASVIVGIMLPASIAERYSVAKTVVFTALAILVIWICFIGFGYMITHIAADEVKKTDRAVSARAPAATIEARCRITEPGSECAACTSQTDFPR
jgi:uncharacterized membrane protein YjfL (UPF0719 family)